MAAVAAAAAAADEDDDDDEGLVDDEIAETGDISPIVEVSTMGGMGKNPWQLFDPITILLFGEDWWYWLYAAAAAAAAAIADGLDGSWNKFVNSEFVIDVLEFVGLNRLLKLLAPLALAMFSMLDDIAALANDDEVGELVAPVLSSLPEHTTGNVNGPRGGVVRGNDEEFFPNFMYWLIFIFSLREVWTK